MANTQSGHNDLMDDRLQGLYAITDENLISATDFKLNIELALQGGASIIQYRDKSSDPDKRLQQAEIVCSLCQQYQAISIINDDIELARTVGADGVHLGKHDAAISQAKEKLGANSIIGVSCYNDISLAQQAETNGASYVAFGTMFSSSTKPEAVNAGPEIISQAKQKISIPVCVIGGITEKNIHQLVEQGADMAAVISDLFSAKDIRQTAVNISQHFSQSFNQHS